MTRSDIMTTYVEASRVTRQSDAALPCPWGTGSDPGINKQAWLEKYSRRLLGQWLRWQTPLGVAPAYAEQIREDIADCYEDPLKRAFIEATYRSHLSGEAAPF
jgi:hypothetical protein